MNKLKKLPKIYYFVFVLVVLLLVSISIPTLGRYKNRLPIDVNTSWDGSVASSYRKGSGTSADPYVISNGSELAYFAYMLNSTNYENTYFVLNNNIVLNSGIFSYDETDKIKYTLNNSTFYVKEYTSDFYDNVEYSGIKIGSLNLFPSLDNFKGNFDGQSYTIYGLYISSQDDEVSLFTNLNGNVHDLYIKNSLIYGGEVTAGVISTSNNATVKNIVNDGYVIGIENNKEIVVSSSDINSSSVDNYILNLDYEKPYGEIISTSLTGNCVDCEMTVNGNSINSTGDFEIDLGNALLDSISISYTSSSNGNLTNIKYKINYKKQISSGIVGIANNTSITNIINKSNVYSSLDASGIIGVAKGSTSLIQSYNKGNMNGNRASGLIGIVDNNQVVGLLERSYNSGNLLGNINNGLISTINNSQLTITNCFNASSSNYLFESITDSTVSISNIYYLNGNIVGSGTLSGSASVSTMNNFIDKEYMINTLSFNEFVDNTDLELNTTNVWVYEDDELPILFMDDISNPIASLHISTYSWNDLAYVLNRINFNSTISFSIIEEDETRPIKNYYYYISPNVLTKNEILQIDSWISYDSISQITDEGSYVIYVKIVDYSDNISYLNSEILVLDLSGPNIVINNNGNELNSLSGDLSYIYIDDATDIIINAYDDLSYVKNIKYYVSNAIMRVSDITDDLWVDYDNPISINEVGNYIIYVKATDNVDNVTYANTDIITYGGYELNSFYVGNKEVTTNAYITDKSSVSFNFTYIDTNGYSIGNTHNIISNYLLPKGTKMILSDNKNNKKYVYEISTDNDIYNYESNNYATYPFTLFKEVGKSSNDVYYSEIETGNIDEDYTITVDFASANITSDYSNVKISLELTDSSGEVSRPTLQNSIKLFDIYINKNAKSYISSTYSGTIAYDSTSTNIIPIVAKVNYKYIGDNQILDSTVYDKKLGIAISVVDSYGNNISREYLKNISYFIGENQYPIGNDGIARINLTNLNDFDGNLTINTTLDNSTLPNGDYFLKIYSYVSYDGMYSPNYSDEAITIPITNNSTKYNYSFDVLTDDDYKTILKNNTNTSITFNVLQNGVFTNPNIRVSLYKKELLTAYNQTYSIVDLLDYVTNELTNVDDNIYYVSSNPSYYNGLSSTYNVFNINLINSNFEYNGYKFVFELYDGNKKISTIEKKFIVR